MVSTVSPQDLSCCLEGTPNLAVFFGLEINGGKKN